MESMKGSTDITKRFEHLYTQYRQRFVVIARRYVRNSMVAEDIVAESFVSFYNKCAKLPNDTNIPSYILTIVKNNCLNYLHAQQLHLRIDQQWHHIRNKVHNKCNAVVFPVVMYGCES